MFHVWKVGEVGRCVFHVQNVVFGQFQSNKSICFFLFVILKTKTIIDKNIIRGDFSYDKPKHNNYETKLFNTVHAAQGTTVPINSNLLIIVESNFDFQLYYTALSRARTLSQIKIITGF